MTTPPPPLDLAALMRLHGAIASAVNSAEVGSAATSGSAMPDAYTSLRARAADLVAADPALATEFEDTFPGGGWDRRNDPFAVAAAFHEARTLLSELEGWIRGHIEFINTQAQIEANARAYAEEQVAVEEKRPGF